MRVVLYARVSSEEQRDNETIQNQVEFYRRYLDLYGKNLVDVGTYLDDGISGMVALEDRPEGARLLQDAQADMFEQILVWKLDRTGRDARIILNAVHSVVQAGVSLKSMTEPFETGTPYGDFMLTVLAGVAGLERSVFLERSALGTARAARQGKWLGGIVPYGYRVNEEGYLEVSEAPLDGVNMTEADVVRLIYDCVANRGWSTIKVADHLNALGIPTAYGKDGRLLSRGQRKVHTAGIWRPGRIRNMIVNPTYRGEHFYGKRTSKKRDLIPRQVPSIVDDSTWNRAQQVLRNNQIEAMRNAKRHYLLRGLVVCGACGLHYTGTYYSDGRGGDKSYYVCNGKTTYRGPLQGKCINPNVPADWLEEKVWKEILGFIRNPKKALAQLRASLAKDEPLKEDLAEQRSELELALAAKDLERQRVMSLYRRGLVRMSDVEAQLQEVEREENSLRSALEALAEADRGRQDNLSKYESAEALLVSLRGSVAGDVPWEIKRDIVKQLVKEVRVERNDDNRGRWRTEPIRISITYLFQ